VRQNDENQSVQQQTAQLGNTLACGDPAAEQVAGQLECHGAGDGDEGCKGDDLLDWVHLIRVYKILSRETRLALTALLIRTLLFEDAFWYLELFFTLLRFSRVL